MPHVQIVKFSFDSISLGDPHPELEGDMVVVDHVRHMLEDDDILVLRATAFGVTRAHSRGASDNSHRIHRFELAPQRRVVRATLPLRNSEDGHQPLGEEPRVLSFAARRLTLERGMSSDIQVADLLDLPQNGTSLALRGEGVDPLLAELRQSDHPLSTHIAVVIDAATQAFRQQ